MTPSLTSLPDPQLLSQALAACTVGMVMTDACQPDYPIVYVNPAFEALSGYSASELLGRNCRLLQGQDGDQPGLEEIRRAVAQGRNATVTLRNYRKDGNLFYNELSLSPVYGTSGTLTHYLGFQNDVTEREVARQLLTSTLERVMDGFISFDQHLNFSFVNPAAAAMLGTTPAELIGQHVSAVFATSADQPISQAIHRARETGSVQRELSFVTQVGRWLEATAYPAGNGVSLFVCDLTQQRQAQEKQRDSEERFTKVFEASPIALVVTQLSTGHYLDVNSEFLRQSGYSREELIGQTSLALNFWVDPLERAEVWNTLQAQGEVRNREVQFRQKSGAVADTVVSIVPVMIGREGCVVTLVRDVTQEKQAQRVLAESEARSRQSSRELQRTLNLSLDMITSVDAEGRFVTVSAACQHILGYTPEELIGHLCTDFVHPDDQAITLLESSRISAGQPTTTFQNRYLHKSGGVVWMEWTAVTLPGDPLLYGVARDVTQRRAAQEDQAYLAAIVQASQDAIWGVTLGGIIRSWNAGAERIYGYSVLEAVGQSSSLIVAPEGQVQEAQLLERVGAGQRVSPFESVRLAQNGRQIPVFVTVSPVLDAAGRVVGVSKIEHDITARRATEAEIRQLNENLKQQLRHLTGLREIDQAIASSQELPVTLGMILDNVTQQLGADAATLLLLDPPTLTLEYAGTRGFTTPLQGLTVRVGAGLAGEVALSRRPLSVPDLQTRPLSPTWRDILTRERLMAYYGAPLIAKGKVLGVMEVLHRAPFEPSATWLETFEMLTAQAAIAVDNAQLFQEVEQRNLDLRLAYDETIEGWARALDQRDKETEGHSRRVTETTVKLCRHLGISSEQLVDVRRGALLHDIGKMAIPDAILLKPGQLTQEEWVEMRKHPGFAVHLLSPIKFLRPALDIPQNHHEKWDGTGYPAGLQGEEIPLCARAFAVVDVYDALTSDRPYRAAWTREQALQQIQSGAGTHFDPQVVQIFLQMLGGRLD
ncbi:PAS domain S-box protein [Deinococcus sp. Arct2-2]|uniref:PAS domain S-box protein n=1 Tax=Deinococcus sp. Arct2-2 TaxID=2568653 RepID=UPI0010A3F6C1|nr:PAS domain S-box protein [Deinococcus sp. Arct2-2]THF69219.1 PAS domain S-box protein [Deinococcus sp. Arct2-2]